MGGFEFYILLALILVNLISLIFITRTKLDSLIQAESNNGLLADKISEIESKLDVILNIPSELEGYNNSISEKNKILVTSYEEVDDRYTNIETLLKQLINISRDIKKNSEIFTELEKSPSLDNLSSKIEALLEPISSFSPNIEDNFKKLLNKIDLVFTSIENEGQHLNESQKKEFKELINEKDYRGIIHLSYKYPHSKEVRDNVFNILKEDFAEIGDVAIKREILRMLDEITDFYLKNCSTQDFGEVKSMKIEVEKLYENLTDYLQHVEKTNTLKKVDDLEKLVLKIENVEENKLDNVEKIVSEIQNLDNSLNKNLVYNNNEYRHKYESIIESLSRNIKDKEGAILYSQNRKALRRLSALRKQFNKAQGTLYNDFDENLLNKLVEQSDLNQYDGLLPETIQFCESVKQEIISMLPLKQHKVFAEKVIEREFKTEN